MMKRMGGMGSKRMKKGRKGGKKGAKGGGRVTPKGKAQFRLPNLDQQDAGSVSLPKSGLPSLDDIRSGGLPGMGPGRFN